MQDDAYHDIGFRSWISFDTIDAEGLCTKSEAAQANRIKEGGSVLNQDSISNANNLSGEYRLVNKPKARDKVVDPIS